MRNKHHRGVLAHPSLEGSGEQKYNVNHTASQLSYDTSSALHLEKLKPVFQPFDLVRHHNHLSFPAPHSKPVKEYNPQSGGFWTVGTGMCN